MIRRFLLAIGLAALWITPVSAAVLIVQNGKLIGATEVSINGSLYDVLFQDGTCASVFSGCDASSDFFFQTSAQAQAASSALGTQVFIDGPSGNFNTHPELTLGCSLTTACAVFTPYATTAFSTYASSGQLQNTNTSSNSILSANVPKTSDFSNDAARTWAVWSVSAAPEPSTWLMMILGFGSVGHSLRRRRLPAVPLALT